MSDSVSKQKMKLNEYSSSSILQEHLPQLQLH